MFSKKKIFLFWFIIFLFIFFLLSGCSLFSCGSLYVTSNPNGAQIYLDGSYSGKVTPSLLLNLSPGSHLLKVIVEDSSMSREESITIFQNQLTSVHIDLSPQKDYRALCIGVDEYLAPGIKDLRAPSYDVDRMRQVFEKSYFDNNQSAFTNIDTLIGTQATRENILQSIGTSFLEADSSDISYFYFSGHGYNDGETSTILPYDALAENASKDIAVDELALALGNIPGTKIVILDSCHSGGFIGKELSFREILNTDNLGQFNENVLESFAMHDTFSRKSNLASGEFKVIVSASGDQECWETLYHPIDGNPFGYFSASLCEGCGYNHFIAPYPADYNIDGKITVGEIYQYVKASLVSLNQDAQVYPGNSSFTFIEY